MIAKRTSSIRLALAGPPDKSQLEWKTLGSRGTLRRLLILLTVALLVRHFVWTPVLIVGTSMLPALRAGQIAGVNKLAYIRHPPQRGDIVSVWNGTEFMVKRIVGLPGEELALEDGVFYVNGCALPEPYVQIHDHSTIMAGKLPMGHFVVAGDNRLESLVAVVTQNRILGRVVY
jgi:signal peptidase I